MAKSGQLKTNTEYDSYFWVKWEQNGNQDIANNRTPVLWSCGVYCGHNFYSNAIKMSPVSINGTQVYKGGTYSNYSTGNHTIATGTMWIEHNADGKKKFSIADFTGWLYSNHNYSAKSTEFSLEDIPRQATITSAPNFNDEANPTITFSNPAGNNATILSVCISSDGKTVTEVPYKEIKDKTATSFTFKLEDDERKALRKVTSGNSRKVYFVLWSKVGTQNFWETKEVTFSIVNGNPIFTENEISYTDTSGAKDITGNPLHIVQNQSTLAVTVDEAVAIKEATISKYDVTVNGVTKTATPNNAVSFGKINSSSNVEISVKVTDSRGFTTTAKKTVTVLPWALPIFTASLERLNNYEDTTYLTVDASVSSVNGKNTMAISYEYKESGGGYITDNPVAIANKTKSTLTCDKNKAYIFTITVADAFDRVTHDFVLAKGKFPLFIDTQKNAVGINDFPAEGEALRVAEGVANFLGGVKIGGNAMPDYIVEQGTDGIWIYRKWASGIAECWGVSDAITQTTATNWNVMTSNTATPAVAYPFTFVNPPVVSTSVHIHNMNFWLVTYNAGSTTHTPTYQIARGQSASEVTFKLAYYVFGQWKK